MTSVRLALSRSALVAVLVAALVTTLLPATPAMARDRRPSGDIRDRLEHLINAERERHGLRTLRVSPKTQYGAQVHAGTMARTGTLFHDADLAGAVPRYADAWSENVGRTTSHDAAKRIHALFMRSGSHRAAILNRHNTHMGIGVYKGAAGYTYVTQRFLDS